MRSLAMFPLALALATVPLSGCASKCGTGCPAASVYVGAPNTTMDLPILDLAWAGPACPAERPRCGGDSGHLLICTHVEIVGQAPGECALTILFADRPAEVVRAQFGPPISQGCCHGFSVLGDTTFTIPLNPDAGIYGAGGNMDAVTILTDGGASPDGPDGGDASDAE